MGRTTHQARGNLRSGMRTYQEGFGAYHPVVRDEGMEAFFRTLRERLDEILPPRESGDRSLTGLPESKYTLYDDPEKMGVRVLERRVAAEQARRTRLQWTPNDIGRLRGEITDEIGRLGIVGNGGLRMKLTTAVPVGDADKRGGGKFALVPEANDPTARFLASEHEIIVNGVGGVFKNFRYPYSDYLPHMTVVRIHRGTPPAALAECAEALQETVQQTPVVANLEEIRFFAHQEL